QRAVSGAAARVETVLDTHPWLRVTERIAEQQGFFHWDLDFSTVFERGGFDLQIGNPPWVRPDWNEAEILSDFDVSFALEKKIPADQWADKQNRVLVNRESLVEYLSLQSANEGTREFLGSKSNYPITSGLRADMYRCFMEQTWGHLSTLGVVALIHPESHFTDDKATRLRRETYLRLRQHWQFINELQLFSEIAHIFSYGVHVYKIRREEPEFVTASSIYHPSTVERSLLHEGSGARAGIRNQEGYWELSPHASRIVRVDRERLASWGKFLNNDSNISPLETSSIFLVNQEVFGVINALSESGRIGELSPSFSQGWNETTDFKKGRFKKAWGSSCGWDEVIIQGPNIHVSTPIYKFPNSTMNSHGDWHYVDLEQ